jgi:hypothetical protein
VAALDAEDAVDAAGNEQARDPFGDAAVGRGRHGGSPVVGGDPEYSILNSEFDWGLR